MQVINPWHKGSEAAEGGTGSPALGRSVEGEEGRTGSPQVRGLTEGGKKGKSEGV